MEQGLLEEEEQELVLGGWAYNVVMDCEQNPNSIFDISLEGGVGNILKLNKTFSSILPKIFAMYDVLKL